MKQTVVVILVVFMIYVPNILAELPDDDCLCKCPCFSIVGKWLWQDNSIVQCYPRNESDGTCVSTNGQHAVWRELTAGGYEVEWSTSQSPHVLSIETVYVADDGTKLVGSDNRGRLIKCLKMKLKRRPAFEFEEPNVVKANITPEEKNDIYPEYGNIVNEDDRSKEVKDSPEKIRVMNEIKDQLRK